MSIRLYLIIAIVGAVIIGGISWRIWDQGYDSGKASAAATQQKYEKKVKKNDVQIDKKTPFNATRDAQLRWLHGYTVRQ